MIIRKGNEMKRIRQVSCIFAMALVFLLSVSFSYASDTESSYTFKTGGFSLSVKDSEGSQIAFNESSDGDYKIYSANLEPGEYEYEAELGNVLIGSGHLNLDGDNKEITLRQVIFPKISNQNYSVKVTHNDLSFTGIDNISYQDKKGTSFVVPALDGDDYYNYEYVPGDDAYWGSNGKMYVYESAKADTFQGLNLSDSGEFIIAPKRTISIQTPEGSNVHIYHRVKFYRPLEEININKEKTENGMDYYTCVAPDTTLHYEVTQQNKVKKAASFNVSDYIDSPLVITELTDRTEEIDNSHDYHAWFESNLLYNGGNSKEIDLKQGEYFDLVTFRSWQAIDDITRNYYIEPEWHYEVIQGDSVSVDDEGRIRADKNKDGVSVVKITYDPLECKYGNNNIIYSALWKENTGIVVVNVGGESDDSLKTGIDITEFDTVYYTESINGNPQDDHAEYTFKPTGTGEISVRVQEPFMDDWSQGWSEGVKNEDNSFTIKLKQGRNIVEVKCGDSVKYHVISAIGLGLTIDNLSRPGEEEYIKGDRIKISFDGLKMPIPKLGAIYNPGYPQETWVKYDKGPSVIESEHLQYNIREKNSISVSLNEVGDVKLTGGRIHTTSIGESGGMHNRITKASMQSSYTGGDSEETINGYFSRLPDISIKVNDPDELEEEKKQKYGQLTKLEFGLSFSGLNYATYEGNVPQALFAVGNTTLRVKYETLNDDCDVEVFNGETIVDNPQNGFQPGKGIVKIVVTPPEEKGYTKVYTIVCFTQASPNLTPLSAYGDMYLKTTDKDGNSLKLTASSDEAIKDAFLTGVNEYDLDIPYGTEAIKVDFGFNVKGGAVTKAAQGNIHSTIHIDEEENTKEGAVGTGFGSFSMQHDVPVVDYGKEFNCTITNKHINKAGTQLAEVLYSYKINASVSPLNIVKGRAIDDLINSVDKTLYKEAEQETIEQLLADGKEAINAAEDEDSVAEALAQAKEKIDAVEKATDIDAAVSPVEEAINALPAPDAITLNDKEAVVNARELFNSLNETEQKYVTNEAILKLAEAVIDKLDAEDKLAKAEDALKQAEADKKAAEEALKQAEADKKAAEEALKQVEADKKAAEEALKQAEADKKAAEEAKVQAEADKKAAEDALQKAEQDASKALAKVSLKKVKGAKKKITVTWKKADGAKGYEVLVSKNKKGTKAAKTYTVKKNATKRVIKKLKKGTYYVKVRAYKTIQGNTVYGKYSKVKKVKVK